MYVRKESVLSSQIEGTQSSLQAEMFKPLDRMRERAESFKTESDSAYLVVCSISGK